MVVSDRYGLYRGFNTSVIQQYGRIKNRPDGVLNPLAGIKIKGALKHQYVDASMPVLLRITKLSNYLFSDDGNILY
ncbi:MAG: hypothetical protein LBK44_04140 [Spirochaetales bacterium]|jgi:hypothetical protein|nr:hypothetical protein [Spirochaetales bacterium]